MTGWLAADEAPANFSIDQDTELRASGESRAAIRYVKHSIDADDVRRHIQSGKQCTRLAMTWSRSEEHTSELQSLMRISYAVFCLKKKNNIKRNTVNNWNNHRTTKN